MIRKSSVYRMLQIGLVLSQFIPGALLTVEAAQLLYENTFENGLGPVEIEGKPMTPAGCEAQKLSIANDPTGGTDKVAKILQQGGQECVVAADLKHRALMAALKSDGSFLAINQYNIDYFFGVRFYIKEFNAAYYNSNGFEHAFWNTKSNSAPEAVLTLGGKNNQASLTLENRYVNEAGVRVWANKTTFGVPQGQWVNLIIQVRRAIDNTGILKVWVNGVLAANFTNTRTGTAIAEVKNGPFTRFGTYWGYDDRQGDVEVYFDDWRIATGSDGFDMVNPSKGAASTTPPAAPTNLQLTNN